MSSQGEKHEAAPRKAGAHAAKSKRGSRGNRSATQDGIGRVVDRGTDRAERVHRAIASWPLDALERMQRLEKPVARVRKLQDRSITASYEFVRGVNTEVAQLMRDASRDRRARGNQPRARRSARPEDRKAPQQEAAVKAS